MTLRYSNTLPENDCSALIYRHFQVIAEQCVQRCWCPCIGFGEISSRLKLTTLHEVNYDSHLTLNSLEACQDQGLVCASPSGAVVQP